MKNVFELKSSWDPFFWRSPRTTNHFSHCTFVGSSWWCKLVPHKKQFSPEWLMKIRSRTELYDRRVLFWMINSDPQSRGDGTRDHHGWWTLAIMINDLSICPHYNISDRRKVHSIIETSDRSVSSPWLYWSDGPRAGQLFPWWFITTILQVLFDVWLWAVFVIIVFFCFNCRHHPGRRMVNGHNWDNRWRRSDWSLSKCPITIAFQATQIIEPDLQSTSPSIIYLFHSQTPSDFNIYQAQS